MKNHPKPLKNHFLIDPETLNYYDYQSITTNRFTPETILETLKSYDYQVLTDRFIQNEIFTIQFFCLNWSTVETHGRASILGSCLSAFGWSLS